MAWVSSVYVASGSSDSALPLTGYQPTAPTGSATIDGVSWSTIPNGSRVLLLNQGGLPSIPAASNGVWIFNGQGNLLTRPTDPGDFVHATTLDNETVVRVSQGATLAHTEHACVAQTGILVDSTPMQFSRQFVRVNVRDFGAIGDGIADDTSALLAAANAAALIVAGSAAVGSTVVVPAGIYRFATNSASTPSNVTLAFEQGAMLAPAGIQLTINGRIVAHPTQQIFDGTGPLSTISHTGSGPMISLTGGPLAAWSFKLQIVGNGVVGVATFQYSLNNGAAWSTTQTTASTYAIPGTGLTVNFPAGTYTGDTYSWSSSTAVLLAAAASDECSVKWWGAQGDGSTDDTGAILSADAGAFPAGTLYFPTGSYVITSAVTFTSAVRFLNGAILSPTSSVIIITFNQSFQAHPYQRIFSPVATVVLLNYLLAARVPYTQEVWTSWWCYRDATGTSGVGHDDTQGLRSAVLAAAFLTGHSGGKLKIANGYYRITDSIVVDQTNVSSLTTAWSAGMTVKTNDTTPATIIWDSSLQSYFGATNAGLTGSVKPNFAASTTVGSIVSDNGVYWRNLGPMSAYHTVPPRGIIIEGDCGEVTGTSTGAVIYCDFVEPTGTGASLSSSGVLSGLTGYSFEAAPDTNTWLRISNSNAVHVQGVGPSVPTCTCAPTNSSSGGLFLPFKIMVLTGGVPSGGGVQIQYVDFHNGVNWNTVNVPTSGIVDLTAINGCTFTMPSGSTFHGRNDLTHTAGSGPTISLSGTASGGGQFAIKCTTNGALNTAAFSWSSDGGQTWAAFATQPTSGSPAVAMGDSGLTATFGAGTYSTSDLWNQTGYHAWLCYSSNGDWQISVVNSTGSVTIADPTGVFTISASDAGGTGGLKWTRPIRAGISVRSIDCILRGFCVFPMTNGSVILAATENTYVPQWNQYTCSHNRFERIQAAGFILGHSIEDSVIQPGYTTATQYIGDGEEHVYERCTAIDCGVAFWWPARNGECFDFQFNYCEANNGQSNGRAGLFMTSGSAVCRGCDFGYCGVAYLNLIGAIEIYSGESENSIRFLVVGTPLRGGGSWAAFGCPTIVQGGRISVNLSHPDGRHMLLGGGPFVLNGVRYDSTGWSTFCIDCHGSPGNPAAVTATGCFFGGNYPFLAPLAGSGRQVKVTMHGCYYGAQGPPFPGAMLPVSDLVSQVWGS